MRTLPSSLLLYVAFFLFVLAQAHAFEGIAGCGGFVSYSPEVEKLITKKIDYSVVQTKLLTLDGAVKEDTECAPNGYYFLPVYEKGEFKIKIEGPTGWIFEPKEIRVTIGEEGECRPVESDQDEGQDINFYFTGFTLSGKVKDAPCDDKEAPSESGPKGVEINLKAVGSDISRTAITNSKGEYSFTEVYPGSYIISASHDHWHLTKSRIEVTMEWDNLVVPTALEVGGYDVSGRVEADGEGVKGVEVLFYSRSPRSLPCRPPADAPKIGDEIPKCVAVTATDGSFSIPLPCGQYTLRPRFAAAETQFDLSPSALPLTVSHDSVVLPHPFQVKGFSMTGKVTNAKGKGIAGVRILMDGSERATTAEDGSYKLEGVTAGDYRLEALKEHLSFAPQTVHVHPSSPHLPIFVTERYSISGSLAIPEAGSHTIVLRNEKQEEIERKTVTNKEFNFLAVPGVYHVEPLVSEAERAAGKMLTPSVSKVTVVDAPVLNVVFSRARVTVSGHITCLEPPCPPLTVLLDNGDTPVSTVTEGGKFLFKDVIPGKYKVSVSKDQQWCWDNEPFDLEVQQENVTGVHITQTGYLLRLEISHDVQMFFHLENDNKEDSFQLTKGTNRFCLPKPGVYDLTPKSCYKFEQDVYKYSTSSPQVLKLEVTHYKLGGSLSIQAEEGKEAPSIAVNYRTKSPDGTIKNNIVPAVPSTDSPYLEYFDWIQRKDIIQITPVSDSLLFYPPSLTLSLTVDECPSSIPPIEGRPGIYLSGKTEPPVGGVLIRVLDEYGDLALETETEANGHYTVGPLYDDQEYILEASKLGFQFEERPNGNFRAFKLGQLKVNVRENGKPVEGILVSLSSSNYRSNNLTSSSGTFTFYNLAPGQYFLRPHLKEYTFEPSSQQVVIEDGMDAVSSFSAVRTAFSCYGSVATLTGEVPEDPITVEAVGKNEFEQAQTDANGNFRLRGLQPQQEYVIRLKSSEASERSVPAEQLVKMPSSDVHDISFAIIPRSSSRTLSVTVTAAPDWKKDLQLRITPSGDSAPLTITPVGPSGFAELRSLPPNEYLVELLVPFVQDYNTKVPSQRIDLRESSQGHLTFKVEPSLSVGELAGGAQASLFGLLMGVLAVVVVIYHKTIITFIRGDALRSNAREESSVWIPQHVKEHNRRRK